ncbi:MAG: hypothetical protein AAFU71_05565 [Cyanobacteria bacterium J06632_22]
MTYSLPMQSLATATDAVSSQPIGVIISALGDALVQPGETLELSVIVTNKGNQSAVFDVFLDELPAVVHPWCRTTQTRLALAPGQGEEVVFEFDVPVTALSGAYRFWLVVDAPNHYADTPPLRYEQTLQVLPPARSTRRDNDPTFAVEPVTTSRTPVSTLPGNPLQFQVHVYNRADRVDRFRLRCPDLPNDWVRVDYPQGFQAPGLSVPEPYLDLNPDTEGIILLTVTPPADALARTVLATLQLKSENDPALTLLDVLYLTIKPIYQVDARFRTLVSRVQQQAGLYSVQVSNQGNTSRTLNLSVLGLEGGALCDYTLSPETLRLAPQQTLTSDITVQPKSRWKRPVFGGPRLVNFEVLLTDPAQKPLPDFPMPGLLTWEARPWWQVLPFVMLLLGSVVGLIVLTWWFFIRPPAPANILRFAPESTVYEASRGDTVHLGFDIDRAERIQQIEIIGQSVEGELLSGPLVFDLSNGLPPALEERCRQQRRRLTCRNIRTDARRPGDYIFTLTAIPKRGRNAVTLRETTLPVAIAPVPLPTIMAFAPTATDYAEAPPPPKDTDETTAQKTAQKTAQETAQETVQKTDKALEVDQPLNAFIPSTPEKNPHVARVDWIIDHPEQLAGVQLVAVDAEGTALTPSYLFDFTDGLPDVLTDFCVLAEQLVCRNIPTGQSQAGTYAFELTALPLGTPPETPIVAISDPVTIQARLPRLLSFTLNGEPAEPHYLVPIRPGDPPLSLELAWEVENNPGTQVALAPAPGDVATEGVLPIPLTPDPGETVVSLMVTNSAGEQLVRSITITTYDPAPESPTIVVNTGDAGGEAGGDAAGAAGGGAGVGGAPLGVPIPPRPGTVSPRELPPEFE